jgi:hypothetical protein
MSKITIKQQLVPKMRLSLILLFAVLASVIYLVIGHPKTSSAATGCTALPTTKGAVVVSSVSVPTTGTYHVWSHIKTADTTNNSFLFQTDNNCNINIGDSASIAANTWTWVDYRDGNTATKADVSLSAGTHPMEIAGREDNVLVDRILCISDTCVPTSTGDNCVIASDTTPPTVSLTAPAAGVTVSGSSVAVTANASDDTGVVGVQFKIDGNNLNSEDVTSPYATTLDTTTVANGSHTITATARDIAGHSTTSASVSFTVDNGSVLKIGETTITAGADSGNANRLIAQQATLGQSATIQSMSFYVVNPAGNLRLGIYDASGPSGGPGVKKAETAQITPLAGWNTANVVTQVSLPAGSYWLAYLPSDNNLSFRNSSSTTTPSRFYTFTYGTMPSTFSTTTSTTPSHWSLYATLSLSSATDTTPPTVSIASPASGVTVSGTSVAVSANASDNVGVAGVQFKLDGVNLSAEDTASPYSITWDTSAVSNGTHALTAVARDAAGLTTTSTSVSVTVNNVAAAKSGDINGDNSVNITDLSLLLSSYNQNVTQCTTNAALKCDLSSPGDGVVNIFDLSILLSHYGT